MYSINSNMKIQFCTIIAIFFAMFAMPAYSQNLRSYTVSNLDNPAPGYILTDPITSGYATIYDNSGQPAYFTDLTSIGQDFTALRILENGKFACYSISTKEWIVMEEDLSISRKVKVSSEYVTNFHTLHVSSTGSYLLLGNKNKTIDMSQKVPNGKTNATLKNLIIQEIDVYNSVVFQWDCSDHIDVTDATEDVNLTATTIDPYHINQVVYDFDGNILISFRNLDAVYKISRSTGEIIWIMGGTKSRRNQFTFINDTRDNFSGFSHQHDPNRLSNGNILLFDNGNLKTNQYSRAVEYEINESAKTATKVWEYRHNPDIYAKWMGNAQRLPNGNTMIGWGANEDKPFNTVGTEVTYGGQTVFELSLFGYTGNYQVHRKSYKMKSFIHDVSYSGLYSFNDVVNYTGISLNFTSITGNGLTSVEMHKYAPHNITYSSSNHCTYLPFRWVINNRGITNFNSKLSIDPGVLGYVQRKSELKVFFRQIEGSGDFTLLPTAYNETENRLETQINQFGEFFLGFAILQEPTLIYPTNNYSSLQLNSSLKWKVAFTNDMSHLQVSTTQDFSNIIIDIDSLLLNEYKLNNLKHLTRYFWRVKATNGTCTSNWSSVYSFITVIGSPTLSFPENKTREVPLSGNLKWNGITGAELYKIHLAEDSLFMKIHADEILTGDTVYICKNLKPLTKYYWKVVAAANSGYGNWSGVWNFTTSNAIIELKEPTHRADNLPLDITFIWDSINSMKYYHFQLSTDPSFKTLMIDSNKISKNEVSISGLKNSTYYYWSVRGVFRDTSTPWSNVWYFSTEIAVPKLLSPTNNAENLPINAEIAWQKVKASNYYHVQISKQKDFANIVIDTITAVLNYSYSNFDFNSQYYWRVRAFDGKYYSSWSDVFKFLTQRQLLYPKLNELNVSVPVNFKWYAKPGCTRYYFRIAEDSLFKENFHIYTKIYDTTFKYYFLESKHTYWWSIKPIAADSTGTWTEAIKFTTQLGKPTLYYPAKYSIMTTSKIKFNWFSIDDIDFYSFQLAYDSSFKNIIIDAPKEMFSYYMFTDSLPDSTYYWRVSVTDGPKLSPWSDVSKFQLKQNFIDLISPKSGDIWHKDKKPKTIRWSNSIKDSVFIELMRMGSIIDTVAKSAYSFNRSYNWVIPDSIETDTTYQIRLTVKNHPELLSLNRYYFIISPTSAINNTPKENNNVSISHYPNPVSTNLTFEIKSNETGLAQVLVYNMEGVLVEEFRALYYEPGIHSFSWEPSELPNGVYYYILNMKNQSSVGMMTIIR
ncbi:MAG: hypothetical protein HW421_3437 [Ignavibacteria bacterium]|nr:hypothetical protein [Ignavibacteria bacterium]